MFIIKRNSAGQQQVIFAKSGKVAATYPNRILCHEWLERNYPEYVEGTAQYILRMATEAAQKAAKAVKAMNEPLPASHVLNVGLSCNRAVWRARD